ncbi:hypothetical protein FKM82_003975 [Ascaphus truei]
MNCISITITEHFLVSIKTRFQRWSQSGRGGGGGNPFPVDRDARRRLQSSCTRTPAATCADHQRLPETEETHTGQHWL